MKTGKNTAMKPKRATMWVSPPGASRLYRGSWKLPTGKVMKPCETTPGLAHPTWVSGEHWGASTFSPMLSCSTKVAALHWGNAVGLPRSPAGSSELTSRTFAQGTLIQAPWKRGHSERRVGSPSNSNVVSKSAWAPACVLER